MKMQLSKLALPIGRVAGFTMIELLIVITILGILAVAVLSAINPIEQINRGRDTGTQSDAEQLINAVERYNAFQGYAPWSADANTPATVASLTTVNMSFNDNSTPPCSVLGKLSVLPSNSNCTGTNEVKQTYVTRISDTRNRPLFIYNRGEDGDSTYVCFDPESQAFNEQANTRCVDTSGSGLPDDLSDMAAEVCGDIANALVCLP